MSFFYAMMTTDMKLAHIQTVSKPIERLIPHPQNPNTHDDRQIGKLRHLIKVHGYAKGSVVYQKSTGYLIAGHGIVQALKKEGYTHVDAIELDIDDDQAKAFMIADNKVASDSVIDDTALQNLINELSANNVPALDFAFDDADLQALADKILDGAGGSGEVVEDDFDTEQAIEPITQKGDLWLLGKHRVLCGDSTNKDDVDRLMGGVKAELCVTSPPYYNQRPEYSIFESYDRYNDFLKAVILNIKDISNYPFILAWNTGDNQPDCLPMIADQTVLIHGLGFVYLDTIIWRKASAVYSIPRSAHIRTNNYFYPALSWEPIIIFRIGDLMPHFDKEDVDIVSNWHQNVWDIPQVIGSQQQKIGHPAIYPIELVSRIIRAYSQKKNNILDLFLGSGSTCIAAEQLNRQCYGMEIDAHYVDVIVKRFIDFKKSADDVYLERNGQKIGYAEVAQFSVGSE